MEKIANKSLSPRKQVDIICVQCGKNIGQRPDSLRNGKPIQGLCSGECEWKAKTEKQQRDILRRSGVGDRYWQQDSPPTFSFFPVRKQWDVFDSYYIYGPVGTGKTWLLSCIVMEAAMKGRTSVLVSFEWLKKEIRATYNNKKTSETEVDVLSRYRKVDILCLDDIGTGSVVNGEMESSASQEWLLGILDYRYRERKPVHITSNVSPNQLYRKYGLRVASRIEDMCKGVYLDVPLRKKMQSL